MVAEERLNHYKKLWKLSQEFIDTATDLARVIIEEISLPPPKKTLKPRAFGGIAGGEKYLEKGIFFKFAFDVNGIYGGHEFAQKAAGHGIFSHFLKTTSHSFQELNGLKAYYNARIDGLHFPFMLLIDYSGFRLIGKIFSSIFFFFFLILRLSNARITHRREFINLWK